jgi:Tol biopolymer transport system component
MGLTLSSDDEMVAVRQVNGSNADIWVKPLGGAFQPLTLSDADEKFPVWQPGTSNVTFLSNRNGHYEVWSRRADGAGDAKLLADAKEDLFSAAWTPDGKTLLLQTAGKGDILTFRPGVDSVPLPLLHSEFREGNPSVSPDGHWIAYDSDVSGRYEVWVAPFPDVGNGRKQVSIDGGWHPKWAHSGRELFFEATGPTHSLMSVQIQTGPSLVVGRPVLVFPTSGYYGSGTVGEVYDFTADDRRFLFARRPGQAASNKGTRPDVVLVNNFGEVLEQMVGR